MPISLGDIRAEHFESRVGERFRFLRPDAPEVIELVLLEVKRTPDPEEYPGRPPFSLLFELEEGRPLSVHSHRLVEDREIEECQLLITRVWVPRRMRLKPVGMFYEVVFA